MKENKYDDSIFFEKYGKMPRSEGGLEKAGEWHALRKLLPDMRRKRVLDLGCGYGWHCQYAIEEGAASVVGVDISAKMLAEARKRTTSTKAEYRHSAIEDFDFSPNEFDFVISSLAFHYISDFGDICRKVWRCLAPNGDFVFSVEHPVFTAQGPQEWCLGDKGEKKHWPVDGYFHEGERTACFLGEPVVKYHRTITTYLGMLLQAGFVISAVVEPKPAADIVQTIPEMRDELRRPMMLLVAAHKP